MRIKFARLTAIVQLAAIFVASSALAEQPDRTFGGYLCTDDCSGHAAGYLWAEEKEIDDPDKCPEASGNSFYEGCIAYTEDPDRGADEDDDGEPIVPRRARKGLQAPVPSPAPARPPSTQGLIIPRAISPPAAESAPRFSANGLCADLNHASRFGYLAECHRRHDALVRRLGTGTM